MARLRGLGEAGLRHVVLQPIGALVSRRYAATAVRHLIRITRGLRSGR